MGRMRINLPSKYLHRNVDVDVILPEEYGYGRRQKGHPIKENFPVLTLLHGYNSDYETWERNSAMPFFTRDLPLCIVLPSGYNLWYGPGVHTGMDYTSFLAKELPEKLHDLLNISLKREDSFIGGLSMGGFGAVLQGLKYPERYSRVISFSGVTDLDLFYNDGSFKTAINRDRDISLGNREELKRSGNDFEELLQKGTEEGTRFPSFYVACGTEDPVIEYNRNFRKLLERYGVDHTYTERPGGHDWWFWDVEIRRVFEWLPLDAYKEER